MTTKISRYFLPILWMVVMFYFSNQPSIVASKFDLLDFIIKKTAHVSEYAILVTLWNKSLGKGSLGKSILISLVFAFSDETHQLFIPGRTGAIRDVFIDSFGIFLGSLFTIYFPKWKVSIFQTHTKTH